MQENTNQIRKKNCKHDRNRYLHSYVNVLMLPRKERNCDICRVAEQLTSQNDMFVASCNTGHDSNI